jgi:hypothetical protein
MNLTTAAEYLASLPADRREAISKVRATILKNLPQGYEESIQFGMIGYGIPLSRYPNTYNGRPLEIAALANQKNYMALYLMAVYASPAIETWFKDEWAKTGKKLDMGKSCLRFKKLDDLPLELIGRTIAKVKPEDYILFYESHR